MKGSAPQLSVVIVTRSALESLALPLPGLLQQTIAAEIELLLVAPRGVVTSATVDALGGFHSVRLLEVDRVANRGREAGVAVAEARAPFVALHENHTRADRDTFERMIAAHTERTAATGPIMCAANPENPWGLAMYALCYGHCAPPAHSSPRTMLPNHNSVYRTDVLRRFGTSLPNRLMRESALHGELVNEGYELRLAPETRIWHLNESRPERVIGDSFYLGRSFGCTRSTNWPLPRKCLYAAAWPAIAGLTAARFIRDLRRTLSSTSELLPAMLPAIAAASAHAAGEVRGYFDAEIPIDEDMELHEFHVAGRLAGRAPSAPWLAEALEAMPAYLP